MGPIAVTVSPETSLEEAAELFASKGLLGAPVLDESDRLLGTLTETDIVRFVRREFHGLPRFRFVTWRARVRDMVRFLERRSPDLAFRIRTRLRATKTRQLVDGDRLIAGPDDAFDAVGRYMVDTKTTLVPVVEGGRLVGTVDYDMVRSVVRQELGDAMSG